MRVQKHGRIVDIPVRAGTVVRTRESRSGKLTDDKGIVVRATKANNYSRAYGRQVLVCTVISKTEAFVQEKGAGDLYPVGRAKRVPKICKTAAREYKDQYSK